MYNFGVSLFVAEIILAGKSFGIFAMDLVAKFGEQGNKLGHEEARFSFVAKLGAITALHLCAMCLEQGGSSSLHQGTCS